MASERGHNPYASLHAGASEKSRSQASVKLAMRMACSVAGDKRAHVPGPQWLVCGGSRVEGGGGGEGGVEAKVGAVEESGEFGEAEGEAFGGGCAEGEVAQFAAGAGGFSVEVEMG